MEDYALFEISRGVSSGRSVSAFVALGSVTDRLAAAGTAFPAASLFVVVFRRPDGLGTAGAVVDGFGRPRTAGFRGAGSAQTKQKSLFSHRRVLAGERITYQLKGDLFGY